MTKDLSPPWYSKGLKFKCTGCGKCCSGSPGYVWISPEEIEKLADFLKIGLEECVQRYIRQVGPRYSLRELPPKADGNVDCVFLDGKACTIYPVRPLQCKTYPWWPQNMESPESWKEVEKECEGAFETEERVGLPIIQENLCAMEGEGS